MVGDSLEGTYHEDGEFGPTNEMAVRVQFDDQAGKIGSFQLAKVKAAPAPPADGSEPEPQAQPEPKSVFDFVFHAQHDGRFHLSTTKWLVGGGGTVQFLASDDSFVFSLMKLPKESKDPKKEPSAPPQLSSWTAMRRGAPRKPAAASGERRTMLQRYGWYLFAAIGYAGYKAGKELVDKKSK